MPAADYLVALQQKTPREFDKLRALLDRAGEVGPQNIRNPEKVKTLGKGLFEFKSYQERLFWCYGSSQGQRRTVLLLDGVTKKRDKHRPSDLARAREVMRDMNE
ncbi:MAG: type II toxin-antitoxin system RelE/ParE family toxin [Acidimicrobiia bacterium]